MSILEPGRSGAERWHRQMFPECDGDSAFIRWKKRSTGWNIALQLWEARQRAVDDQVPGHLASGSWPCGHAPVVLYLPHSGYGACTGCEWLGDSRGDLSLAAADAVRHAFEQTGNRVPVGSEAETVVPVYARNGPIDGPAPRWVRSARGSA